MVKWRRRADSAIAVVATVCSPDCRREQSQSPPDRHLILADSTRPTQTLLTPATFLLSHSYRHPLKQLQVSHRLRKNGLTAETRSREQEQRFVVPDRPDDG